MAAASDKKPSAICYRIFISWGTSPGSFIISKFYGIFAASLFYEKHTYFTDKPHFSSQVKEDPGKEKSLERKIWERTGAAEGCWWGTWTSQSLSRREGWRPSLWVTQQSCIWSRGSRIQNVQLQYHPGHVASMILMWFLSWCISLELNGLWISPGRLEIWELDCSIAGKGKMIQVLNYQESLLIVCSACFFT